MGRQIFVKRDDIRHLITEQEIKFYGDDESVVYNLVEMGDRRVWGVVSTDWEYLFVDAKLTNKKRDIILSIIDATNAEYFEA